MTKNTVCHLQVGLLGPFFLLVDQKEIKPKVWKSKKALTMLKYLATKHGQRVSSDVLIELLWPDNEGIDSTSNLHTAVWYVRRILASEEKPQAESPLRYSDGTYWLDLGGGCIDTHLFESHVKTSQQLENSNFEMALYHCEAALQLYRDDFLIDEPYEDWTISPRNEYRELYFQVALRAAELLIKHRKDFTTAAEMCRKALKKDPFREEFYHVGIQALILGERYIEAVNAYKKYSQLLMEEFQLEPSPTIQELVANMRENQTETLQPQPHFESEHGAYPCDQKVLHSILEAEQRRIVRSGNHFAVLIVHNKEEVKSPHQFQEAFYILQRSLRHCDLICKYTPNVIVAFLPDTDAKNSQILVRRLQKNVQKKLGLPHFSYEILNSQDLNELKEKWGYTLAQY